jgi:hypothetical protein
MDWGIGGGADEFKSHISTFFILHSSFPILLDLKRCSGYSQAMARALRMERAGVWYHVTARSIERRAIYRDERDRGHFCGLLAEAVGRFRWALHCYMLPDNHLEKRASPTGSVKPRSLSKCRIQRFDPVASY